jgi:chromosomal replication initiation ATPase DnaA
MDPVTRIIHIVNDVTGVTRTRILSGRRDKISSNARQIVMFLARKHTKLSRDRIAIALMRRSSDAVRHGCEVVEERMSSDLDYADSIAKMSERVVKSMRLSP